MSYRVGIDIGGTFTDVFAVDTESGDIFQEKVSTTPDEFARGAIDGLEKLCADNGIPPDAIGLLSHGTTVATNAMIEEEGAETGLITTQGFRDVLAIARENRSDLYNYSPEKTPAFVDRRYRIGVPERVSTDGEVVEPLDEDAVRETLAFFEREGVETIAVSFINAYRNPVHEERVKELVAEHSEIPVSLSSEVMPEIQEYERTLMTVIDAYVNPAITDYVRRLESEVADVGVGVTPYLMQSNGGVITPDNLSGRSSRLINSGPTAGVTGARRLAEGSGVRDLITLDIGGTSADVSLVRDGENVTTTEGEVSDVPLLFPQVDIRTIGAGGGSIAWLDETNSLHVGPKSAGAQPGPACYGRGGTDATVTDAALLLGYLNPDYFLGGEMGLDVDAAADALEPVCDALGATEAEIADGILEIVTTNMTEAIRLVTVEKGYDPRAFALACFGGAGPMFGTRLARQLELDSVLIPAAPGVLSATGLVAADERFDFSVSRILEMTPENRSAMAAIGDELRERVDDLAADVGDYDLVGSVDLRYYGQISELTIDLPAGAFADVDVPTLLDRFHRQYESIYGHSHPEKAVQATTWRLRAVDERERTDIAAPVRDGSVDDALKHRRSVYVDGEYREVPVYDRYRLPVGAEFDGPALIEETESTTVVETDATIEVDATGNVLIRGV